MHEGNRRPPTATTFEEFTSTDGFAHSEETVNISTISPIPILVVIARVLVIASVVSLGFVGLLLLEGERTKKLAQLISRTKR